MAEWNSTFADAINPAAEQLGSLDTTTVPTLARATQEWNRLGPYVSIHIRAAGMSGTVGDWSDDGLAYFRLAESLLTAGMVLSMKGTVIRLGKTPEDATGAAAVYWQRGLDMLDRDELRRLARGLVAFTGAYLAADGRIGSDWTRNRDPDYSTVPEDDRAYAREPASRSDDQL